MSAFDRLEPALQHHIVNTLGWRELREVQELSIEACLDDANMVVLAPTAGGKTESAFFPVISRMLAESWKPISVIYLSPIKALLNNQERRVDGYLNMVGRRAALWHGDTTQSQRKKILSDPSDCLLTTPESLEAILVSRRVSHADFFANIRVVIIDELHAFAGDDRGWHLLSVLSRIARLAGRDIQRIGLSATVGNPDEMLHWVSSGSSRTENLVRPETKDTQIPDVQLDYVGNLANAAAIISRLHQGEKRLVFCDSRSRVEQLSVLLRQAGVETFVSHSSLGIDDRRQAEKAFAERQNCVIVATSSLELGLDVGDLDRVIQIDAPGTVSSFLQRMGRTGRRAGTQRNCLFLATNTEGLLKAAALIELWESGYVEPVEAPVKPLHILAQQLMGLVLQEQGVGRSQWFEWVDSVPGFKSLTADDKTAIIEHMIAAGILFEDSGIVSFGPEGESTFGRRNFMEILSVFTSDPLFRVLTGQKELGFVDESTFYKQDESTPVLVLAGRSWKLTHLDWNRRIAHVEATDQKGKSRWLGEGQMLSRAVCQSMRRLLASDDFHSGWSARARNEFSEIRNDFPWINTDSTALVQDTEGRVKWWTFAGGLANTMLAHTLKDRYGAASDNLSIRFTNPGDLQTLSRVLGELDPDAVQARPNDEAIDALKFSECLPTATARKLLSARLSDRDGVHQVLGEPRRVVVETG